MTSNMCHEIKGFRKLSSDSHITGFDAVVNSETTYNNLLVSSSPPTPVFFQRNTNFVPEIRLLDSNSSDMTDSDHTSVVTPHSIDGLTIPIDDNEYAFVDPIYHTGLTYEIFVSKNNIKPRTKSLTHERSSSFTTFNTLNPIDSIKYKPRRNSADYYTSNSIPHGYKNRSESSSYDSGSDHNSYDKLDSKDKSGLSLFEANGLFIKKDHPLFNHTYSRKVFVGGLPRDISIESIKKRFQSFGDLHVDWPNRDNEVIPPNGFAFLHFDNITSVEKLFETVCNAKYKNKYTISSHTTKNKEVEIKFWKMTDCEFMPKISCDINSSYTVFVGALPRTVTAFELAMIMEDYFSQVDYAAIDVDITYGYPKGAGRVTFHDKTSFTQAIDSHYIDIEVQGCVKKKRIEIKPFLLNDQKCDICVNRNNNNNNNQPANKYCYICESFICEDCEFNRYCKDGKNHNLIGRSNLDQSFNSVDY